MAIDKQRAAVARMIVRETFGKEIDHATDVSGVTGDPINQAAIAHRMNTAGRTVTVGTIHRWTNVDPADVGGCSVFGNFYALAYAHLTQVAALAGDDSIELLGLVSSRDDLGGIL